jgi:hypothetical protein
MHIIGSGLAAVILLLASRVPASHAQLIPQGGEFVVNTYTTSTQHFRTIGSSVAMDAAGNFVIVWSSRQDGSVYGVFGQRFDRDGNRLGGEFQVNTYTTQSQDGAKVASDAAGNFVVVWTSDGQDDGTGGYTLGNTGVFGQRFDAGGNRVGGEFQVNTYTTSEQGYPDIAMQPNGFVVVWETRYQHGDRLDVSGQRFDSAGQRTGPEFQINTYTTDFQHSAAVATDSAGNFLVVWTGKDDSGAGVFGRFHDSLGVAQGGEFQVNVYTTQYQNEPAVAWTGDGFVTAWSSFGQDGSGRSIQARLWDAAANPIGVDFQVNAYTTGSQTEPDVAADASGNYVVVWNDQLNDDEPTKTFARVFDPFLTPQGGDQLISPATTLVSSVAASGRSFVVAWDTFPDAVMARRYARRQNTSLIADVAIVRPGKLFKFVAHGSFPLPDAEDDPTQEGAVLGFAGTTGTQTYPLPTSCWTGLGPGNDGSKGYKCQDAVCKLVLVKPRVVKGVCRDDTGTFTVPDPGPLDIQLAIGDSTAYCARCGGTIKGNPDVVFKRTDCVFYSPCP